MNARERQMVQNLLVSVSDATTIFTHAFDTFGIEFKKELERQKEEAIEDGYRQEDQADIKAQAERMWGKNSTY